MSTKLNDLKKVAELHMQKEVDILEMVMELDNSGYRTISQMVYKSSILSWHKRVTANCQKSNR
jgi:hypothetical protein